VGLTVRHGGSTLSQPLVPRPAYGQGGSGTPGAGPGGAPLPVESGSPEDEKQPAGKSPAGRTPVGEAKLPGDTEPAADKGLALDKGIPGTSTFNKPEDDIRDFDRSDQGTNGPGGDKNTAPQRRDSPDDQLKDRERVDVNEDYAQPQDGIGEMGKGKTDQTPMNKTPYPYRDDPKHPHYANAEAEHVAQLFLLRFAHEVTLFPKPPGVRTAATIDQMTQGLEPAIQERGDKCSVGVKRVDAGNLRWIFAVNCGNGAKVVRLKAERVGNIVRLAKMQLRVSCSCPAWRWLGPEYHAKKDKYLDGRPAGTASTPDVKDPRREHQVCKHVAAVLSHIRKWEVPLPKDEKE
jgi:hypothetical protein